jgi:hypothetical protein
MPPLPILDGRAFLVSPLEMPTYLLELPDMKDALIEGEIRSRLKTLYPGDPENTELDYTLWPRRKKTEPRIALAHVCSRLTGEMCRGLQRPLIPGTTLMRLAMNKAALESALCVIATEEWVEAALFEEARVIRYGSCPVSSASSEGSPFSFITSFGSGGESGRGAALFIRTGSSDKRNEETEKALLQFFDPPMVFDINEVVSKRKLKSLGIFNDSRRRSRELQRRSTGALIFLNCVSLLLSLHSVSGRTKLELFKIEKQEKEHRQTLDRAKALEDEIAELLARNKTGNQEGKTDPYSIITGLQHCLSGAWIKSLVIQGDNFDLEAEGADSIAVLQSLQRSDIFSELSLRRASSSPIAGDQFFISGRAGNHEKK